MLLTLQDSQVGKQRMQMHTSEHRVKTAGHELYPKRVGVQDSQKQQDVCKGVLVMAGPTLCFSAMEQAHASWKS